MSEPTTLVPLTKQELRLIVDMAMETALAFPEAADVIALGDKTLAYYKGDFIYED